MDTAALLIELYDRIPATVDRAVDGLTADQLVTSPVGGNPVGWLVWHLARVQDGHIAELLDRPQLWEDGDWADRFGLEPDPRNTGYGHDADDVARVRPDGPGALTEYLAAVWDRTRQYLGGLADDDLDQVVDEAWDPPVTLAVRLVSIADDDLQHAGQAAYARGQLGA